MIELRQREWLGRLDPSHATSGALVVGDESLYCSDQTRLGTDQFLADTGGKTGKIYSVIEDRQVNSEWSRFVNLDQFDVSHWSCLIAGLEAEPRHPSDTACLLGMSDVTTVSPHWCWGHQIHNSNKQGIGVHTLHSQVKLQLAFLIKEG